MSIINLNQSVNEIKSIPIKSIRSTLLVPQLNFKMLDRLTDKYSLEELITKFSFLIENKIIIINPNLEKHTTLYQGQPKVKLDLIRCHLRCNPMVWHHWKRLANLFGVSMCNLFIICLKKVSLKELESVGTSTEKRHVHNFLFYEITNSTRSYSHRWFYSKIYRKNRNKKL